MNVKLVVIIAFSYLYGLFELLMNRIQRKKSNMIRTEDKGSLWILTLCITLGYLLSFMVAATRVGRMSHWNTWFFIGLALVLTGLTIRISSILTLRHFFTYTVSEVDHHRLIEKGLYKSIRHPGYLGQLIIFLGIPIALSNWLSVILMMIPVLLGYMHRIRIEERFLEKQMGEPYLDYQTRTHQLIPKVF
jgi:protein-S-isoprenylcysteine O-methyltransferase Ste14